MNIVSQCLLCLSLINIVVAQQLQYQLMQIDMTISNGMSKTDFLVNLFNPSPISYVANVTLFIPEQSSISKMQLNVNGKIFKGIVLESMIAKQRYEQAKSDGRTTGLVERVRATSVYALSFFIGASQSAQFTLTYEELLVKRFGNYESWVYVRPGFVAQNISINALVQDATGIQSFSAPNFASASVTEQSFTPGAKQATLRYHVSQRDQEKAGAKGIAQDLVIKYSIPNLTPEGTILYQKNYFVHFFSPSGLVKMGKNIVFAIDISGSMGTTKMEQAKTAVLSIIAKLTDADYFNVIAFTTDVRSWKASNVLMQATSSNKQDAQNYVTSLRSESSTNINDAMITAIQMLKNREVPSTSSIIILLTDGQPTAGETNGNKIRQNIIRENQNRYAIFCLGFGFDLDYMLLRNIAYQNGGSEKRIYEDVDASQQIANYYDEISAPLLTNIQLSYTLLSPSSATLSSITKSSLKMLFEGSQFIVAGKVQNLSQEGQLQVKVSAMSATGDVQYLKTFSMKDDSAVDIAAERTWAFTTIMDALRDMYIEQSDSNKQVTASYNNVLALALKYQLVTPITSMVVEQMNETSIDNPFTDASVMNGKLSTGNQASVSHLAMLSIALIVYCIL